MSHVHRYTQRRCRQRNSPAANALAVLVAVVLGIMLAYASCYGN